jgi:hypothetical protein
MDISLFVVGENLNPADVSSVLGGLPHLAGKKRDPIFHTTRRGKTISRPAMGGYWRREVSLPPIETVGLAVEELFAGLTSDAAVWRSLGSAFRIGISVGDVASDETPQSIFSESTLASFQQRGLDVSIPRE